MESILEIGLIISMRGCNLPSFCNRVVLGTERNISSGLKNLLMRILEKDPAKRITMTELRENEWINEGYSNKLNSEE